MGYSLNAEQISAVEAFSSGEFSEMSLEPPRNSLNSTMIVSRNPYDISYINDPAVSLVHIKLDLPGVFNRISGAGFGRVCNHMSLACASPVGGVVQGSSEEFSDILRATVERRDALSALARGLFSSDRIGFHERRIKPHYFIDDSFQDGTPYWHFDIVYANLISSVYGPGVEYVVTPDLTVEQYRAAMQRQCDDLTLACADPGDIVVLKGRYNDETRKKTAFFPLHRTPPDVERFAFVAPFSLS